LAANFGRMAPTQSSCRGRVTLVDDSTGTVGRSNPWRSGGGGGAVVYGNTVAGSVAAGGPVAGEWSVAIQPRDRFSVPAPRSRWTRGGGLTRAPAETQPRPERLEGPLGIRHLLHVAPIPLKRRPGAEANLEIGRATFALEGNAIVPHPETTAAGVGKRWDWGKIRRESGRFLETPGSARAIEKLRQNQEALASHINDPTKMSNSRFCGGLVSKPTEPIRLGPWEFHGNCRATI
jgi:hypothetical protein